MTVANIAMAGLVFLEPVLFGRVVDVLSRSIDMTREAVWGEALALLALWAAVGLSGIVANIAVSLLADRMAHRSRLGAMAAATSSSAGAAAVLPWHVQSGRLMKVMLTGSTTCSACG